MRHQKNNIWNHKWLKLFQQLHQQNKKMAIAACFVRSQVGKSGTCQTEQKGHGKGKDFFWEGNGEPGSKSHSTSFFQVTRTDHPNGGHLTREKATNKTPKKVTTGRTWLILFWDERYSNFKSTVSTWYVLKDTLSSNKHVIYNNMPASLIVNIIAKHPPAFPSKIPMASKNCFKLYIYMATTHTWYSSANSILVGGWTNPSEKKITGNQLGSHISSY